MSAMREAFERWSVEGYAQSLPLHRVGDGYGDGETDIAWNDFHAGWQACMEHIKAQGAAHWYLENEDEYMSEELRKEHERLNSYTFKLCKVATPLYKLPEDES